MTTRCWTRQVNDHLTVEAHVNGEDAYLVIVHGGNRLWLELDEAKGLIEALTDEAGVTAGRYPLAGVVAGDGDS